MSNKIEFKSKFSCFFFVSNSLKAIAKNFLKINQLL